MWPYRPLSTGRGSFEVAGVEVGVVGVEEVVEVAVVSGCGAGVAGIVTCEAVV